MDVTKLHLLVGWSAMLLGVLSGAVIGLFFHREEWVGGYGSFRRRLLRLGHLSFFGLGFVNLLFGLTVQFIAVRQPYGTLASYGFVLGVITMPLCCFLTAWHKPFRHLFPLPVISVLTGMVSLLLGWSVS
jgi:hypothetical protein